MLLFSVNTQVEITFFPIGMYLQILKRIRGSNYKLSDMVCIQVILDQLI